MHSDYHWDDNVAESNIYDFKAIIKHLNHENNKCILDYGCGNGSMGKALMGKGYTIYGVDASETGVTIANEKLENECFFKFDFDEGDLPDVLIGKKFDTVISTQVIEHVYSPDNYIKAIYRILPKGGQLYITTPYHGYFKNLAMALTGKLDNHFTALWEGGHIKFFSKKTLSTLLKNNGFSVICFEGMERIPFLWKSMLLIAEKE